MEAIFLKLLNMSITTSWLIMAIIVIRAVFQKAPKAIRGVLWAFVGARLLIPFNFQSVWSLIPSAETISPEFLYSDKPVIRSGIPAINQVINPILAETMAPVVKTSVSPVQIVTMIVSLVWLSGMMALLAYAVMSYIRLVRQVRSAMWLKDRIWLCDQVNSPFILGFFRPRIYLPSGLAESTRALVIAHEMAHIKRQDHWWKPLGFALMAVYWFNPLIWLAYILLCRDIEYACDEQVVKGMGLEEKKAYSIALLTCSTPRRQITACPLAFGESGVKQRIRQVLHFRRPAFWIILVAIITCIVLAVSFLTNPLVENNSSLLNYTNLVALAKQSPSVPVNQSGEAGVRTITISGEALAMYIGDADWTSQQWGRPVQRKSEKSTESIEFILNGTVWLRLFNTDTARIYVDGKERYYQMQEGDYAKALKSMISPISTDFHPYVSSKCLYMNPISSQRSVDDSGLRYLIGSDFFSIQKKDSGEIVIPSTPITESWQSLEPDTWNAWFRLLRPEINVFSTVQKPKWRKLSDSTILFDMDGALWIGQYNGDRVGMWSIYTLIPESDNRSDQVQRQVAQADLDRDGSKESIAVLSVDEGMLYQLAIIKTNGTVLWQTEMATAHVGWDSLFLCTIDNQDYLLRYNPTMFQGECAYSYGLFTLKDGKENVLQTRAVTFDVNGKNLLDVDALTSFASDVNKLLQNSVLLLSTEGGNVDIGPSGPKDYLEDYDVLLMNGATNLTEAAVIRAAQVYVRDLSDDFETITNFDTPPIEKVDASRFDGLKIRVKNYDADGPFYTVTFNTKRDALLGPIVLFLDARGTVFAIMPRA